MGKWASTPAPMRDRVRSSCSASPQSEVGMLPQRRALQDSRVALSADQLFEGCREGEAVAVDQETVRSTRPRNHPSTRGERHRKDIIEITQVGEWPAAE